MPKLPPYSAPLSRIAPTNSIYLFIGRDAWNRGASSAKSRPTRTIALPPYHNPDEYSWPVNGCDVLMFDTSGCDQDYIDDIADCLLLHGATVVRYVSVDNLITNIYQNS